MIGESRAAIEIQRKLNWLLAATVVLYLLAVGFGVFVYIDSARQRDQVARVAKQSSDALCTLRADLRHRVAAANAFLKQHPGGIPGLPAAAIRMSVQGQQRTIDALEILHCPPDLPIGGP